MITEKDLEKIERAFLKKQLGEKTTTTILSVSKSMKCGRKIAQRYLFCYMVCGVKCEIDKEDRDQNTQYDDEMIRTRRNNTWIARNNEADTAVADRIAFPPFDTEETAIPAVNFAAPNVDAYIAQQRTITENEVF